MSRASRPPTAAPAMTPVLTELPAGGGAGCCVALMAGLVPGAGPLLGIVTTLPPLKSRCEAVVVVVVVVVVVAGDGVTATGSGLVLLGAELGRAAGGFGKGSLQELDCVSHTAAAVRMSTVEPWRACMHVCVRACVHVYHTTQQDSYCEQAAEQTL
jgi:hypothetical protein